MPDEALIVTLGKNQAPRKLRGVSVLALSRLAALTLAKRLGPTGDNRLSIGQRRRLMLDAGLPLSLYANPATESILTMNRESLGKGGLVGQISNDFSARNLLKHPQNAFMDIIPVADLGPALIRDTPSLNEAVGHSKLIQGLGNIFSARNIILHPQDPALIGAALYTGNPLLIAGVTGVVTGAINPAQAGALLSAAGGVPALGAAVSSETGGVIQNTPGLENGIASEIPQPILSAAGPQITPAMLLLLGGGALLLLLIDKKKRRR